jgi:tetratricopeptide (TPR) repeat protein
LSNVCLDRGKISEAEQFSKRALSIYEQSDRTTRSDLGKAANQLGLIRLAQKSYSGAEASFKRAIDNLNGSTNPDDQVVLAVAMDNLGSAYLNTSQLDKAESIRKQAVATCERSGGPNNPELAKCLMNLAAVYGRQSKFEEALPYLKRAEEIDESVLGLHHPTTLQIVKNYALILKLTHRDEELSQLNQRLQRATSTPSGAPGGGRRLGPQS